MNTCSEKLDVKNYSSINTQNVKPRRKKNIDDKFKNLESRDKEYREPTDVPGLYFRVQPNGKKSWQFRYKNQEKKWAWVGLGSYPKVGHLEAFEIAQGMLTGEIEICTQKEKKQAELIQKNALFGQLIEEFLLRKKKVWEAHTYKKEKQSIEKHLIPVFGHRQFASITPAEWLKFFTDKQDHEQIYNRIEKLVSYCVGAYDLAKFKGEIEYNPLQNINRFLARGKSESMKHVGIDELPDMVYAIRTYSSRPISIALELLIHMFPRPQELRSAKWEQFNFEESVWIRPADIMKKRIEHAIPLSTQVVKLLNELKDISGESDYLFPSRDSINKPISNLTFNAALNRLGYRGKQNPHGFRHIASSNLNKQFSEKAQVIESALAHLKSGVKGAYDKEAHLKERYEIMQWWSDYIESLLNN